MLIIWIMILSVLAYHIGLRFTPITIDFCQSTGIEGIDVMKDDKRKVAELGGPAVMCGFLVCSLLLVLLGAVLGLQINYFALVMSITTITLISLASLGDALSVLTKEHEGGNGVEKMKRVGFSKWVSFLFPLIPSIPMIVFCLDREIILLSHNLTLFYSLVLVPVAILCCSNATNMLAGFNGLEAGMGSVILFTLGIKSLMVGSLEGASIAFIFLGSLLAFLKFNWYPAKIFPGGLNYVIGSVVACVVILARIEIFGILAFIPWIIEAFLKARSKFRAESFGKIIYDDVLKPRGEKIRSLTHVVMTIFYFTEERVTISLVGIEAIWCFYLIIRRFV